MVVNDRRAAVRLAERNPFIGLGEHKIVSSLRQRFGDDGVVERAGVGKTDLTISDHPDADSRRCRRGKRLDFAAVGLDLGRGSPGRVGLYLFARFCHIHNKFCDLL